MASQSQWAGAESAADLARTPPHTRQRQCARGADQTGQPDSRLLHQGAGKPVYQVCKALVAESGTQPPKWSDLDDTPIVTYPTVVSTPTVPHLHRHPARPHRTAPDPPGLATNGQRRGVLRLRRCRFRPERCHRGRCRAQGAHRRAGRHRRRQADRPPPPSRRRQRPGGSRRTPSDQQRSSRAVGRTRPAGRALRRCRTGRQGSWSALFRPPSKPSS